MIKFKVFSTGGMIHRPIRGDLFRVGWWVGKCVLATRWFVVMKTKKRA